MKRKWIAGIIISVVVLCFLLLCLVLLTLGADSLLTDFIDSTNIVCSGQRFTSPEEAVRAMEDARRAEYDTSLDFCPPYQLQYSFDFEGNTIIFYSYCRSFDGTPSNSYAVRILKHNDDGTLSFDGGFAEFQLNEPDRYNDYYYYTNIQTSHGKKSISFLYLPADSEKDIYVDGNKAEKIPVSMAGQEFYVCYAVSGRDTLLKNLFTPIHLRHNVDVK